MQAMFVKMERQRATALLVLIESSLLCKPRPLRRVTGDE